MTNNAENAMKKCETHTSTDQVNADPIAVAVVSLVNCLKADYAAQYERAYKTDEDVRLLKRRLYQSLRAHDPACIYEGYEICADLNPKTMPTVQQIEQAVVEAVKERHRKTMQAIEATKIGALPGPNAPMPVNVRTMFDKIIQEAGKRPIEEIYKKHEAMIKKDLREGKIRIHTTDFHPCAVSACGKPGTLTGSATGSGNWYCGEHFR